VFLGHYGVAFGAKAAAPKTSLGTLFIAAQFADLLWPVLLLAGVERVIIQPGATRVTPLDFAYYPYSHSLLAVAMWALCLGVAYHLLRRYRPGAIVVGLLVISHWLLDTIVHKPDLPLYPGGTHMIGLGLWSSLPETFIVESLVFAAGLWLYIRSTASRDAIGRWALWVLVLFLAATYLAGVLGPPPPNVTAIALAGMGQWLFIFWAYWIDRHRVQAV